MDRVDRVVGVDVARGLAVLGMFTAHLGDDSPVFWTSTGWMQAADGRSAAGFALLAGVSAALLSGGPSPEGGLALRHARVRILARAAVLWPLGVVLIALGTPVAVILPSYAVMFALLTVVLHWSPRRLLLAAGGALAVGPLVAVLTGDDVNGQPTAHPLPQILDVLVGDYYPVVVWIAYMLVGLAVGRHGLPVQRLAVWGLGCAVVGYGTSAVAMRVIDPVHTLRRALLTAAPHSDTAPEVVGNTGVVLVVLALCLVAGRAAPRVVAPLAATGALALTAYCGQIVAIAVIGTRAVWVPSNGRLAVFVLVTLMFTTTWRALLGRGPLERALHGFSTTLADAFVRKAARRSPADVPS